MERKRIGKMNEMAYFLGQIILALGVALTSKAGFGVSMVVSPAYVLHVSLVDKLPWYTFGTSEYIFQGALLLVMILVIKKFKWQYLLSFVSALIYGLLLDLWLLILGPEQYSELYLRIITFAFGIGITSISIAMFFRTYMPVEVYELFVSEITLAFKWKGTVVKWVYDCSSLVFAVILTLLINGNLTGVGIGSVITAVVNAPMIAFFGKLLDRFFIFDARWPKLKHVLYGKEA